MARTRSEELRELEAKALDLLDRSDCAAKGTAGLYNYPDKQALAQTAEHLSKTALNMLRCVAILKRPDGAP